MTSFENKVALVTGGASGIGRATALAFARGGAKVLISDINDTEGLETVQMIRSESGQAVFVKVDIAQKDQVAAMVNTLIDSFGCLDYAVNNAGYGGVRAPTAEYPEDEWQRVIDINLTGVWYCMKYELDQMVEQGYGVIVNLASVAGVVGFPSHAAYSASKHAVVGLTKTAALEYIRKGIRINAVCPGFIETPMLQKLKTEDPAYARRMVNYIPARRTGSPEEVAEAILYLCSDKSGFMTGHSLVLDGGVTAG